MEVDNGNFYIGKRLKKEINLQAINLSITRLHTNKRIIQIEIQNK
jgi:hypothetical protein